MEDLPQLTGRLLAGLLCAAPALYFLEQGLRSSVGSRRLANLALACGFSLIVLPEIVLGMSSTDTGWFLGSAIRAALGVLGISLAVAALMRRRDGQAGIVRIVLGGGLSLLHLGFALVLGLFALQTGDTRPRRFDAPDGSYQLMLPGSGWQATTGPGVMNFLHVAPRMRASVLQLKHQQTQADFEQIVAAARERVASRPQFTGRMGFQEVIRTDRKVCVYWTQVDDPSVVAMSVTWLPEKQIVAELFFEGVVRSRSEFFRSREMRALSTAAEVICLSVE